MMASEHMVSVSGGDLPSHQKEPRRSGRPMNGLDGEPPEEHCPRLASDAGIYGSPDGDAPYRVGK